MVQKISGCKYEDVSSPRTILKEKENEIIGPIKYDNLNEESNTGKDIELVVNTDENIGVRDEIKILLNVYKIIFIFSLRYY